MATFFIVSFSALVLFLMGSAIVKSSRKRKLLLEEIKKEEKKMLIEAKNASQKKRTHLYKDDDDILDEMHEEMFYLVSDVVDVLDDEDSDMGMEYHTFEIETQDDHVPEGFPKAERVAINELNEDKLREDLSKLEVEATTPTSVDEYWVDSTYEKPSYTPPSYDSGGSSYESLYDSGGSSDCGGGGSD